VPDHKRSENVVAGFGGMIFAVVTAKVKKVEIEHAASLWWH